MAPVSENNVWQAMNYMPPRGRCNYKSGSIISSGCTCLRFMMHPLKVSSSFECDGCNHHASFHSMENRADDEIIKRWQAEAREREMHGADSSKPKKRARRAVEGPQQQPIEIEEDDGGSSRAVTLSSRQHRLASLEKIV